MLICIAFDEEKSDIDIIDIPAILIKDIENLQLMFLKWLFDKSIEHSYWVYIDGEKKYCSYRSEAFVEWINNILCIGYNEKAKIISKNANQTNEGMLTVFF